MLLLTGAWILGEVLVLKGMQWMLLLAVALMVGAWAAGKLGKAICVCLILLMCAGAGRTGTAMLPDPLAMAMEQQGKAKQQVVVEGRLSRLEVNGGKAILYLEDSIISYEDVVYIENRILVYVKEIPNVKIGNQIRLSGELKRFLPPTNPGEFDQQAYYGALDLYVYLYGEQLEILDPAWDAAAQGLHTLRTAIRDNLIKTAGEEAGALLVGMLLGDKRQIPDSILGLFQDAGLAHLMAVSGLHISLFGMGIYRMLRRVGLSYGWAAVVGITIMSAYGEMIGSPGSAVRALLMFSVSLLANSLGRSYDLTSAACLAALIMLFQSPLMLTQCGFLLSYGAVLGIGQIGEILKSVCTGENGKNRGRGKRILEAFIVGIAVQIPIVPVTAWYFFEVPVYGIFLNLLVIPLMAYVVLSGGLGAVLCFLHPGAAKLAIGSAVYILKLYQWLCEAVLSLPFNKLLVGRPQIWQLWLYSGLWALLLYWLQLKREKQGYWKGICLAGFALVSILVLMPVPVKGIHLTVLDVGQGDGIVLRTEAGAVLVDGGSSDIKNVGQYRIEPYLKSLGIGQLSCLVLTHCDADHVNGARYLMESGGVRIGRLVLPAAGLNGAEAKTYEELSALAQANHIPVVWMQAGDSLKLGQASITCLYPQARLYPANANHGSLVLWVKYGAFDALLTGDLDEAGERLLLEQGNLLPRVDVLKAGHHGSKSSGTLPFLEAVDPRWALISCGRDNRYGHPHQEALGRMEETGVAWWATKDWGALKIEYRDGRMKLLPFIQAFP